MALDLSSLKNALEQVEKSFELASKTDPLQNPDLFMALRTATIKTFEFTYEISTRMLKRQIEEMDPSIANIESLGFPDLLRVAAEKEIITHPTSWLEYRKKRNITSHTYDTNKAKEVYAIIPKFIEDVQKLFHRLKSLN